MACSSSLPMDAAPSTRTRCFTHFWIGPSPLLKNHIQTNKPISSRGARQSFRRLEEFPLHDCLVAAASQQRVGVLRSHQLNHVLSDAGAQLAIGSSAASLVISAPAPPASYRDMRRKVCRTPRSSTAAAETPDRLPARTSAKTCIRFTSRSLIEISPIPLVSFLMGGTMTFLKSAYRLTVRNPRYQTWNQ
jgi:hypothetical protein